MNDNKAVDSSNTEYEAWLSERLKSGIIGCDLVKEAWLASRAATDTGMVMDVERLNWLDMQSGSIQIDNSHTEFFYVGRPARTVIDAALSQQPAGGNNQPISKMETSGGEYSFEFVNKLLDDHNRLLDGIHRYLDGDYPCPASYSPNKCPHEKYSWEECGQCTDDYFNQLLSGGDDCRAEIRCVVDGQEGE